MKHKLDLLSDSKYEENLVKNILALMEKFKINKMTIAALLHLKPTMTSDLLSNKRHWKLIHVISLALYFGVPLEELIFSDSEFIKKYSKEVKLNNLREIKESLINEKRHSTLGKLTAEGFFNEIDK